MGALARKAKAMLQSGLESNQGLSVEEPAPLPDMVHPHEVIHVRYQRIYFDWDLPDGTYTPEQLRKAQLVVNPWGGVLMYAMDRALGLKRHTGGQLE
jgi:hypothetical protein